MTAADLIDRLRARGVTLIPAGDRLRYRPASALTADEVEALRQHKAEILQSLSTVIRQRFQMRAKIRALSAEGRFTAYIMTGFPFGMFRPLLGRAASSEEMG